MEDKVVASRSKTSSVENRENVAQCRGKVASQQTILKQLNSSENHSVPTQCLLCTEMFMLHQDTDALLSHLLASHSLVIADVHCIADIKGYIDYWRVRLCTVSMTDICSTLHAPVKDATAPLHVEGEKREFFLLSDVLREDNLLRQGLQQKRLEWVLQQQQCEREQNNFTRGCLFCRLVICGTRGQYLDHLSQGHNLQLGRPHNLVFVDELIDLIEKYFESLQCLYCEKFFKDRFVLREHMRKKMHKRINPNNHIFDQYYAVNYLEMGKNWVQVQSEKEEQDLAGCTSGSEDGDIADWEDWNEDNGTLITCLFCDCKQSLWENMLQHLEVVHSFDFVKSVSQIDFYQKVKLVNYIRHQMDRNICMCCEEAHPSIESLREHMSNCNHCCLPDKMLWDRPEYYFPTHEDDEFLCQLDDARDDGVGTPDCVLGEEPHPQLCQALSETHISEVMELQTAISRTPYQQDEAGKSQHSLPVKRVSFQ